MRNGVGVYSLPQAPYVAGTVISSTSVNSNLSDIANALTQSIASDGQTTPTANLPMGGYRHTGVANATARDNYAAMGQVQDGAGIWCGTAGGTANALTLTPTPAITAYAAGQVFRFTAGAAANTGATTVAVSGLAATAIQASGAALTGGEIAAGRQYLILYDGANFQLQSIALSFISPLTTRGDLYTRGASADTRLPIGAANRILGTDGTDPIWRTLSTVIDNGIGSVAQGDILYRGAANWERLAAGTSGRFLQTQGAAANPQWAAVGWSLATPVASTSGTAIDFTGIPSSARIIRVLFSGVSTNGTSQPIIQLGRSGPTIETTGYVGSATSHQGGGNFLLSYSNGFVVQSGVAADAIDGAMDISIVDASANRWVASGVFGLSVNGPATITTGGTKSLSGTLDRVRITTIAGTSTFDAGVVNIMWQ